MSKAVFCLEGACPYNDKGECGRKITFVTKGGHCEHIYRMGEDGSLFMKSNWCDTSIERLDKEEIKVNEC